MSSNLKPYLGRTLPLRLGRTDNRGLPGRCLPSLTATLKRLSELSNNHAYVLVAERGLTLIAKSPKARTDRVRVLTNREYGEHYFMDIRRFSQENLEAFKKFYNLP